MAVWSMFWVFRYSSHPSSEEVGVPNWWAVSFASPIQTRFCSSCFVERNVMYPNTTNTMITSNWMYGK